MRGCAGWGERRPGMPGEQLARRATWDNPRLALDCRGGRTPSVECRRPPGTVARPARRDRVGPSGSSYRTHRRPPDRPRSTPGHRPPTEARGPHVRDGPVEPALTSLRHGEARRLRSQRGDRSGPARVGLWRGRGPDHGGHSSRSPPWSIWADGPAGGETISAVAARVDRVIAAARGTPGDTLCFAHGHVLRILGARWIGFPPEAGASLALDTATVSILGWERDEPVIRRWNDGLDLD